LAPESCVTLPKLFLASGGALQVGALGAAMPGATQTFQVASQA
jgi:hypothetical protein